MRNIFDAEEGKEKCGNCVSKSKKGDETYTRMEALALDGIVESPFKVIGGVLISFFVYNEPCQNLVA